MNKTIRRFSAGIIALSISCYSFPSSATVKNAPESFVIQIETDESASNVSNTTDISFDLYVATLSSFDSQTGLNEYNETYYDTISVDVSKPAIIVRPADCFSIAPKLETIPEGYGISTKNIFIQKGTEATIFTLSLIDSVEVNYDDTQNKQTVTILNKNNEAIFPNIACLQILFLPSRKKINF